jgi:hypothetical protein
MFFANDFSTAETLKGQKSMNSQLSLVGLNKNKIQEQA